MDEKGVQTDAVPEGTTLPEAEKPQPQPLTEERIQQIVAEQTELAKREIQSVKDRARNEVAEAQRRARLAEAEAVSYKSSFTGLDEETQRDVELRQLRGRDRFYQQQQQLEEQGRQQDMLGKKLQDSLKSHLDSLGIDLNDKRIDWAKDEPEYIAGRSKFDASIAKILKENAKMSEKTQTDKFAEMERKLRVDLGLDSVDTSISAGVTTDWRKLSSEDRIKQGLKEGQKKK